LVVQKKLHSRRLPQVVCCMLEKKTVLVRYQTPLLAIPLYLSIGGFDDIEPSVMRGIGRQIGVKPVGVLRRIDDIHIYSTTARWILRG